jgi:raffinose/stachyose/melibiose transport system substrate-binding protein
MHPPPRHVRMSARRILSAGAALTLAAAVAACGGSADDGQQTLTLWHNYGTNSNAKATEELVAAFEDQHPGTHIKIVSQPQDNYFPLLQSAAISNTGPDLAVMWTGLYALKYAHLLVNLKGIVPDSVLGQEKGIAYTAPDFDPAQGSLVMPTDTQYYVGYYNKRLFQQAGITTVPRTWDELYTACTKLKTIGVTPIVYGNGGAGGAAFVPWFDASYLAAGVLTPQEWSGLYDGTTDWTTPDLQAQLTKWRELGERGCTNSDALTSTTNFRDFETGAAAMVIDGSWDLAEFQKALGPDLAPFVPPFSDTPMRGVVEFPGGGFSITKSSTHKEAAGEFIRFLASPIATNILDSNGLIPNVLSATSTNPVAQQMVDFAAKDGYERYPMLDNVIQPEVADVGAKQLPSVLAGQITPTAALEQLRTTLESLPSDRRSPLG